jgi:phosphodiesterase/alkaline phosphatase D-like protein
LRPTRGSGRVEQRGRSAAVPETAHSVHIELTGLRRIVAALAENPHIRFVNNRRGYVRTRVTPGELQADFQVVPFVSRPGAAVQTRASFVVLDQEPALHPA